MHETRKYWEARFEKGWRVEKPIERHVAGFFEKHREEIGPKVLDVGSGNGRNLVPLAKKGFEMTGLERSEKGIELTKQKLSKESLEAKLVQGDFHDLPFGNEQFDTVFSSQAIQYNDWEGAKKSFSEIARVLKKEGLFFLRVSSTKRIEERKPERVEIKEIKDYDSTVKEHGLTQEYTEMVEGKERKVIRHRYSLEEIKKLASENGLEILEGEIEESLNKKTIQETKEGKKKIEEPVTFEEYKRLKDLEVKGELPEDFLGVSSQWNIAFRKV